VSIVSAARASLRSLRPYQAAVQVDDTIRLNANEAPWRNSGEKFQRPLNRYPEIRPARLASLLAQQYGCKSENLLVTRGTSEAIDLLIRAFCEAGRDNIVTTSPTFSMYEHYAVLQGAELRQVESSADDNFAVDSSAIVKACDHNTKLIFLCSPNNPTGTLIARDTLRSILEQRSGQSAVVIDEAYIEFAGEASAVELLEEFENLVVLRTLSKALAYAGARCGSVISAVDVIGLLDAVQAPYAMATPVIECVEQALQSTSISESATRVAEIVGERERLCDELTGFSLVRRVWPSFANFVLIEVDDAGGLMRHSNEDKVLLRYFGGTLENCVRITVGTSDENSRLLESIARLEAENG